MVPFWFDLLYLDGSSLLDEPQSTRFSQLQKLVPAPALVPSPTTMSAADCSAPLVLRRPLRFPAMIDPGGFELLRSRWTALGIPAPVLVRERADVSM